MQAVDFCRQAATLLSGDRERTHGDKARNHDNIAALWNAYLNIRRAPSEPLSGADVALMMALLKVARTQLGDFNADDFTDGAGYLAVAGEILSKLSE